MSENYDNSVIFIEKNFLYDSLKTLENFINKCKTSYDSNNIYDFVDFSTNLFKEYLNISKEYDDEIPEFTKVYVKSVDLMIYLGEKNKISKNKVKSFISYRKRIFKLQRKYKKLHKN